MKLNLGDEKMKKDEVFKRLKGGLIVSCQALEGEPLYRPEGDIMSLMALACLLYTSDAADERPRV